MLHRRFTGIVLCSRILRTYNLIDHILCDLCSIMLVWNHAIRKFIVKSPASLIRTFQAIYHKPVFSSTGLFVDSALLIPPA